MKRAVIVHNPAARNAPSRERLLAAAASLSPQGWEVDVWTSEGSGQGPALAREAASQGADVVLACGGDGTLNEVINGVAGSESTVGLIRGGMGNVFAKEIGVPRTPEKALMVLADGEVRRFDLGRANERSFLLMAGVGFDAEVVSRVPPRLKRLLGSTAFVLQAVKDLPAYRSARVRLLINEVEEEADLYWLLLGNTRSYGGVINIASKAVADDGLLDAYVYAGRGLTWVLKTAARIATGRPEGGTGVTFERVASLEVATPGLPVQADGEYFGETPMRFSVEKQALPVLLPRGSRAMGMLANE